MTPAIDMPEGMTLTTSEDGLRATAGCACGWASQPYGARLETALLRRAIYVHESVCPEAGDDE